MKIDMSPEAVAFREWSATHLKKHPTENRPLRYHEYMDFDLDTLELWDWEECYEKKS